MTADGFLNGITSDYYQAARENEAERQACSDRLAASLLIRRTQRHDCRPGTCRHRNHARDQEHLLLLLDLLGLDGTPAREDDYDSRLTWHSVTRADMALMSPVKAPKAA